MKKSILIVLLALTSALLLPRPAAKKGKLTV